MTDITTRSALEVVLSRVTMDGHAASSLRCALANEIRKGGNEAYTVNVDSVRASFHMVLDALDGADESFSKRALVGRIRDAQKIAQSFLGDCA